MGVLQYQSSVNQTFNSCKCNALHALVPYARINVLTWRNPSQCAHGAVTTATKHITATKCHITATTRHSTDQITAMSQEHVGIVGAGLVGCLTALAFAKKGFQVSIFDMRPDPRHDTSARSLRSINLALSDRGIRALQAVDAAMAQRVVSHVIPMKGRMIHDASGTKQESQLYGLFGESINSIDRQFLNIRLLEELDNTKTTMYFLHKLIGVENVQGDDRPGLEFTAPDGTTRAFDFDYIIGADGAHSQFRYQMQKSMRMDFAQKYIDMQYMELSMPPVEGAAASSPQRFSLDPHHLHIWPRKDYMLIALANQDGSFTCTFFSPWKLIESFCSASEFLGFFRTSFPDAYELIGEHGLAHAFEHQPRGSLMQVSVAPYTSPNNRAILLGDSAHSMVPFYGQGMNCGFEDVHVLMSLMEDTSVQEAFGRYTLARADDLRAICKLALDNYHEMSTKVTSPMFLLRKKVDFLLGKYANGVLFPWIPLYSMISFRGDIRYSRAVEIERRQAGILNLVQYGTVGVLGALGLVRVAQYLSRR